MPGGFIKSAFKVTKSYLLSVVLFGVFLPTVLTFAKDDLGFWLKPYSIVIYLLLILMMYGDMHKQAVMEKRPQYALNPKPYRGFLYGVAGMAPVLMIAGIAVLLPFQEEFIRRMIHLGINTMLGPVYGFISMANEALWAYILFPLVFVGGVAGLGYLAGHYGIFLRKQKPHPVQRKKK